MRFLSVFAGVGGFDLPLERGGWECAGQIELEPFCLRVLERRWPRVPRWADVRSCDEWLRSVVLPAGPVDALVGGFPCQGASVAGKRLGLADDRTALFWEILRVQQIVGAPWALLENVPGLRSVGLGRDFKTVVAALAQCWPAVGWRTLDSRYFHVAQRRERVFLVAGPSEARVREVLLEPEGVPGHPGARGAAGARPAGGPRVGVEVARGTLGRVSGGLDYGANKGTLVTEAVSAKWAKRTGGPSGDEVQNIVAGPLLAAHGDAGWRAGEPSYALEARENHPPMVGTGYTVRRLTPIECERLQGFPDGWTCLCLPLEAYRDAADVDAVALGCACTDSARYRAMGNAVTTTVVAWIGRRLAVA